MLPPHVPWFVLATQGRVCRLVCVVQVRLRAAVEDFISEGAAPAERMIRDLVDCEHAYINTDHPQFIGGNRALSQVTILALIPCWFLPPPEFGGFGQTAFTHLTYHCLAF